jgi:hypothetical protein
MASTFTKQWTWDWKTGKQTGGPLNYFSCGTYYFDGEFQVVKFPKGMKIFHKHLDSKLEFPIGLDYYRPFKIGSKSKIEREKLKTALKRGDKSVQYEASKFFTISPSWFGTRELAKSDSVYELLEDCVFILLDSTFNIWKLITNPNIPEKQKSQLELMFASPDQIPFASWFCQEALGETEAYTGYALEQPKYKQHMELMICNASRWLKRQLKHQNINKKESSSIFLLLKQMSFYKTSNVDFHAGNLFEHSIWSLLYAEQLVLNTPKIGIPNIDLQKRIATTALIHDIGKMTPDNPNSVKRSDEIISFSNPGHIKSGGDFIRGIRPLPILNENMKQIGVFNMKALLNDLGFQTDREIEDVAKILDLHYEFGKHLMKWQGYDDSQTVENFIKTVGDESFEFFYSLIIVSVADIMASQPFGSNNLTAELKHSSRFFPFINNVPKKYRGSDFSDATAEKRNLFSERILERVLLKSDTGANQPSS